MIQYDVVIVGGGPSGSSLAYLLKKRGVSCCIIDKSQFPREKLCGGLLTEKTVSLLADVYGEIQFPYENISSTVSLFYEGKKLSTVSTGSKFYLVKRYDFDYHLIQCYERIGGKVFLGKVIKEINKSARQIILKNGETISYKILVGADGANSLVRKNITPKYRANAICVESVNNSQKVNDDICVYFDNRKSGYGWCFPKKGYYSVGIGGNIESFCNIKRTFVKFSDEIGKPVNEKEIKGALIPFGKYVKKPYNSDTILVGDAAGLVDPITGEGLFFAFLSARMASEAIVERLTNGTDFCKSYGKNIKKIHAIIKDANRFLKTFFRPIIKKRILTLLEGRRHIVRFYCENLLANYLISYMSFPLKYFIARQRRNHTKEGKG